MPKVGSGIKGWDGNAEVTADIATRKHSFVLGQVD